MEHAQIALQKAHGLSADGVLSVKIHGELYWDCSICILWWKEVCRIVYNLTYIIGRNFFIRPYKMVIQFDIEPVFHRNTV